MCTDNPDMPKEANKAKCFVVACFVLCATLPHPRIPVSAPSAPPPPLSRIAAARLCYLHRRTATAALDLKPTAPLHMHRDVSSY